MEILAPLVGFGGKSLQKTYRIWIYYSYYKLGIVLSKIDIQWREETAQGGDLTQFKIINNVTNL